MQRKIPYRLEIYELLNRTSSRIIVRVAAASGLAQEFQIVLPPKVKIKNSTSSVYSRLYCTTWLWRILPTQAKVERFTRSHSHDGGFCLYSFTCQK